MRKTPLDAKGVAPAPPSCGVKNLAATLEKTVCAENPWKLGTLIRPAKPGIFDRSHSTGKAIGELPRTLKSKALWVYFQMYSPEKTRYLPTACSRPAWNSLRPPGLRGVSPKELQPRRGLSTGFAQPRLLSTK